METFAVRVWSPGADDGPNGTFTLTSPSPGAAPSLVPRTAVVGQACRCIVGDERTHASGRCRDCAPPTHGAA